MVSTLELHPLKHDIPCQGSVLRVATAASKAHVQLTDRDMST